MYYLYYKVNIPDMESSMLTVKGQLLIPKRIRDKYGIQSGGKVLFEETEDGVLIRPVNEQYFKSFKGILQTTGRLKEEIQQMKKEEQKKEQKKLAGSAKPKKTK